MLVRMLAESRLPRRRELEDEIIPEIGPMDMRLLGPAPDELDVRHLTRIQDAVPLDIGLIDAMCGANALTNYFSTQACPET